MEGSGFEPSARFRIILVNDISVKPNNSRGSAYLFELSIDSVDDAGNRMEIILLIEANGIHFGRSG